MNIDCSLHTGKSHSICEDYTRAGKLSDDRKYAILSDGCSGSPDTDIGARILVMSAVEVLDRHPDLVRQNNDMFGMSVIQIAEKTAISMSLNPQCLDATLSIIVENTDRKSVTVRMFGDGSFARHLDVDESCINVSQRQWKSGAPFYLSYMLDEKRYEVWKKVTKESGVSVRTIIISPNDTRADVCKWLDISEDEDQTLSRPKIYLIGEEATILSVLSDGSETFYKTSKDRMLEPVPFEESLQGLLSFKNFNGSFVQRRVNRHIKNMNKDGIYHDDDLSVASMTLDSEKNSGN